MATLKETQDKIDQVMDQNRDHVWDRQVVYFSPEGRYFQGLSTHLVKPADGAETAPDALAGKPTDQAESWNDAGFSLPATMPMALVINVYEGPQGHGYELVPKFEFGGTNYRRVENVGPETWRVQAWTEVGNNPSVTP